MHSRKPLAGAARRRGPIQVELSPSQVDRVMRESREDGNAAILRTRLRVVRETLGRDPARMSDRRLSQSLMAGLLILAAMPSDGSYVANAQIARMLGMNPSTAHRYVSTLVAVDLLERHPGTRRYRLV
jgi:Fic family protein